MTEPRTYLYVPGDRPERFDKALASGADAVIVDLEDAVPVEAKVAARRAAVSLVEGSGSAWIRINAGDLGLADLEAISGRSGLAGVVVPKAPTHAIARVQEAAPGVATIALVESASAFVELEKIAASGVERIALGEVDLAADLRLGSDPLPATLWALRTQAVVAAAAAGIAPPIGPVFVDLADPDGLRATTEELRRGGCWSRQVIHPRQVEVVHEVLTPTDEERAAAARLLETADASGGGVFLTSDGRMIDEAVLRSARHIVDLGR